MVVKLEPTLSHCIETVAKKEYERVLSLLLSGEGEESLVDDLELLRIFLETEDFPRLRSRCEEELLAGSQIEVVLRSTQGTPPYEVDVQAKK